ncbi:hypothetical protein PghCCS26_44600 [Paenibacillus glycanilyticus]|uniref:Uncharacterized protein n=1 Tax=Paenibacillus glycanilyticus TaxID=126569 RepID=A0ABQ6NQJ7_9BACL|nr:hypothetical protein PghCCS26_44600 [Paenibacillus glycanilyticus]
MTVIIAVRITSGYPWITGENFNERIEKLNLTLPREELEALEFHYEKQKNQSFFLRLMDTMDRG